MSRKDELIDTIQKELSYQLSWLTGYQLSGLTRDQLSGLTGDQLSWMTDETLESIREYLESSRE